MKLVATIASLLTLTLSTSALVVHDTRNHIQEESNLTKRNAYQVGVNIMDQPNCQGHNVGVRNHDEHSCNAATVGTSPNWISALVKDDGTAHGYGCMSIFSDTKCGGLGSSVAVYQLDGNECINFAFKPSCVVVASRNSDGSCNIRGPDC